MRSRPSARAVFFGSWWLMFSCSSEKGLDGADNTLQPMASATATSVTSGNPPVSADADKLGASCAGDAECGMGLFCLLDDPDVFRGTIAGGICTADCTESIDLCGQFGEGTWCAGSSERAYCVPRCTPGSTLTKCHGRRDMACIPVNLSVPSDGACSPMCTSNADCPGQTCDALDFQLAEDYTVLPFGGVCVDPSLVVPGLKADGEACDDYTECEGKWCLPTSDTGTSGVCSSLCTFGGPSIACHQATASTDDPAESVCALSVFGGQLSGELGQCVPTCDTQADCNGGLTCLEGTDEFKTGSGRFGLCYPNNPSEPAPSDMVPSEPVPTGMTTEPVPTDMPTEPAPSADAGMDSGN